MRALKLGLLSAFCAFLLLACGGAKDAKPVSEVKGAETCQASPCLSMAEIEARLGFHPLEPGSLPERFGLYSREILAKTPMVTANAAPLATNHGDSTVVISYRFLDSLRVPALTLIETVVPAAPEVRLGLADPSCGQVMQLGSRNVIFGQGTGSLMVGDDVSDWLACASPGPGGSSAFEAYLAHGNIIIEIKAFPESGLTKDDVLNFARSLEPQ